MSRCFNTEGHCEPEDHYMVRLDERLEKIKTLYVDKGKYVVINRGRQYGKTTTLRALAEYLKDCYIVINMDFQLMSTANFVDEQTFTIKFIEYLEKLLSRKDTLENAVDVDSFNALISLKGMQNISLDMLFDRISRMCEKSQKPIVLMIDEVDNASNNEVFIEFLAQLRGYYLNRKNRSTFQSIIIAAVYDIKNLKLKIRPDETHQYNSPWNIAADFKIEMSFSIEQIAEMLTVYEAEHHTGMDLAFVAQDIYAYTSGYPYLVSAICKYLDEEILNAWTGEGVLEAVKLLMNENTALFGSMMRHINEYPDLKSMLHAMLFLGEQVAYNPDNKIIDLACMFGYTVNDHGAVRVANRIFEMRLYNLFLSEEELASIMSKKAKQSRNQFVSDGRLDMDRVLEKF
ncbi:MAG: AAA-like domain-containing protein [Lachnospiraceae bacterium]|nr:AAA-like domain-containing protein [Lachnospiraceae bacterium]